jgi:hypothetical protein
MTKRKLNSGYRKGQFAIEFMSTYGWALLILMAALGALVYFMPNFRAITSEKCTFGPGVACLGTQLTEENLTIALRNSMGQTIYNVSVNTTLPIVMRCDIINTTIRADQRFLVSCDNQGAGNLEITTDSRIALQLNYKKTRDGYDQVIKGDLYAKYR